jgi:hypothetical protein
LTSGRGEAKRAEARAVDIAISNLARTAGFADDSRFVWAMESGGASFETYLKPQSAGGVEAYIGASGGGEPEIKVTRDGTRLKRLPGAFKASVLYEDLNGALNRAREFHSRSCRTLERAMELESAFSAEELKTISSNPIIGPAVNNLVFAAYPRSGVRDWIGFPDGAPDEGSFIASHPVRLYRAGVWADYQKRLLDERTIQPFKQVFREFYTPTEDELRSSKSSRFAGVRASFRGASDFLKSRGWVAVRSGFEKVFFGEKLVASLGVSGDLTGADENGEIEFKETSFSSLEGLETRIDGISPVIFSEITRDVSLVAGTHSDGEFRRGAHG